MINNIYARVLYGILGWKKDVTVQHPKKCIICLAPHTSNLDFIIGQLYMRAENMRINFMMKKEWFFFPIGHLFRHIGGIPVWRSKHTSMTDNLKMVFYYIALKAGIPILLYGVDYSRKLIQCTKTIVPTGDADRDMQEIKQYFKNFKGRYPEKFTTGE